MDSSERLLAIEQAFRDLPLVLSHEGPAGIPLQHLIPGLGRNLMLMSGKSRQQNHCER